jgi:glucuronate isomerase
MNVEVVCSTDDPIDTLEYHARIRRGKTCPARVYPAFRADRILKMEDSRAFSAYARALGRAADVDVKDYRSLLEALRARHAYFHTHGCRLSDCGIETVSATDYTEGEVKRVCAKLLRGAPVNGPERDTMQSALLHELAVLHREKGWVQQYHLGALRNTNTRMMRLLGPDSGFDSIGDFEIGRPLARFLNRLDDSDMLGRTIVYNINPRDNELMATMIGNFQDGSVAGKIQYGPAWWFLDQLDGMRRHLDALSAMGLLSQFVGMVTDSRSFLSYPRHEYFRRILCSVLGAEMERGLLPDDLSLVGEMVMDVSYRNAKRYIEFPGLPDRTTQEAGHA